jgi:hypothetical protein
MSKKGLIGTVSRRLLLASNEITVTQLRTNLIAVLLTLQNHVISQVSSQGPSQFLHSMPKLTEVFHHPLTSVPHKPHSELQALGEETVRLVHFYQYSRK